MEEGRKEGNRKKKNRNERTEIEKEKKTRKWKGGTNSRDGDKKINQQTSNTLVGDILTSLIWSAGNAPGRSCLFAKINNVAPASLCK